MERFTLVTAALLCLLNVGVLPTLSGADLILARDGKTDYKLVLPQRSNTVEQAAIDDLKTFFHQVSGAELAASGSGPAIRVGQRPESDCDVLAPRERRMCTVGSDIYLYGDGEYGAAFAIYDFLEKKLGCRWFNIYGVMTIPRKNEIVLAPFSEHIVPSFETVELGLCPKNLRKSTYDFFRRNRMHILPRFEIGEPDDAWQYIGPTCHSLGYYVPAGDIKGIRKGMRMGPSRYLKDKRYFDTNPEFFSLSANGIRVPNRHYCFSNAQLRRTMTENIDLVLSKDYDPGRRTITCLDINDVNGPFCSCQECQALVNRYKAPGGPFFDYLIEMSHTLGKKYPNVMFSFIAYGRGMTVEAPDLGGGKLPDNVVPSISALTNDISKPLDSVSNRFYGDNLRNWSRISNKMAVCYTPVHWSYPSAIRALAAGIDRMVKDMQLMHKLNVRYYKSHYSDTIVDTGNFRELQLYLAGRLGENINADVKSLVMDFCKAFYGAAAQDMYDYIAELDNAAALDSHFFRWNSSPQVLSYVTPANMVRWQAQFDAMTAKVRNDPEALIHVNIARMDLDQNTVYIWREIAKAFPNLGYTYATVADRYRKNFMADANLRLKFMDKGSRLNKCLMKRSFARGIDLAEKKVEAKPLPASFAHFRPGTVFEAFPEIEMDVTLNDPAAAAGAAIEFTMRNTPIRIAYQDNGIGGSVVPNSENTKWSTAKLGPPPYHTSCLAELEKSNQYEFYYIGRAKLTYDCSVIFRQLGHTKRAAAFAFGRAADPKNPDAEYDFYLSLKYVGDRKIRVDRMVAVQVQPGSRDAGKKWSVKKEENSAAGKRQNEI